MLVQINVDVYAYYEHTFPVYRIWVNDTLYNEREFWPDCLINYIEEEIHVELEKEENTLLIEKVSKDPKHKIWAEKVVIKYKNIIETKTFDLDPQDKQIIKFKIQ